MTPSHLPGWKIDRPLPGIGQPEPLKKHIPFRWREMLRLAALVYGVPIILCLAGYYATR